MHFAYTVSRIQYLYFKWISMKFWNERWIRKNKTSHDSDCRQIIHKHNCLQYVIRVFHKEIWRITVRLSDRTKVTLNKINFINNFPQWDLNPWPPDLHSNALPIELGRNLLGRWFWKWALFFSFIWALSISRINGVWLYNGLNGYCTCNTNGYGFEPQYKPPPILADISVSMWIKKAWLPCWHLYSHFQISYSLKHY